MYKNIHTVRPFETIEEAVQRINLKGSILLDTFFADSEWDGLTKVTVGTDHLINHIEIVYPTPDHHEIIVRERQLLGEMHPELVESLTDAEVEKLETGNSLPF